MRAAGDRFLIPAPQYGGINSARINHIDRIAPHIPIKVRPTRPADRVPADEAARLRVVVALVEVLQVQPVACGRLRLVAVGARILVLGGVGVAAGTAQGGALTAIRTRILLLIQYRPYLLAFVTYYNR